MKHPLMFHHVGIACRSLKDEKAHYLELGFTLEGDTFTDPAQRIRGIFMTLGPYRVELLEALSEDSPLGPFLQKGIQLYHQAFLCKGLQGALDELVDQGAHLVVPPIPAVAFGGRKICFLMLTNRQLIELVEAPAKR